MSQHQLMEALVRTIIKRQFGDYLSGLDSLDTSKFPLTLRNLKLRPDKINQELDDVPFEVREGVIGQVKLNPTWSGSVAITASNIQLEVQVTATKAMQYATNMFQDQNDENIDARPVPPPIVAPRYCSLHNTSEKRRKTNTPQPLSCRSCRATYMTSYSDFTFCAVCSDRERLCMICGASAPAAGNYVPPTGGQQLMEPRKQAMPQLSGDSPNRPYGGGSSALHRESTEPLPLTPGLGGFSQENGDTRHPLQGNLPHPPPLMDQFHWKAPSVMQHRAMPDGMVRDLEGPNSPQTASPAHDRHEHSLCHQDASYRRGAHSQPPDCSRTPKGYDGVWGQQDRPPRDVPEDTFIGFLREVFK